MKKNRFLFENLDVYKKSLEITEEIFSVTINFSSKHFSIANQLNRAVLSVPLNIAEGCGRKTKKDIKNFYIISRGSVFESIAIIEICFRLNLINNKLYNKWRGDFEKISKMISGLINRYSKTDK